MIRVLCVALACIGCFAYGADTVSVSQGGVAFVRAPRAHGAVVPDSAVRDVGLARVGDSVVVAVDYVATPRPVPVLRASDRRILFVVRIVPRAFRKVSISGPYSLGRNPPTLRERADARRYEQAILRWNPEIDFSGACTPPFIPLSVTSTFGTIRHFKDRISRHAGVDFRANTGAPVRAIADGVVLWGESAALHAEGRAVVIDHGGGVRSYSLHLSVVAVGTGDTVQRGSVIGYVGNTGHSDGDHLHLSVKIGSTHIDPLRVFELFRAVR